MSAWQGPKFKSTEAIMAFHLNTNDFSKSEESWTLYHEADGIKKAISEHAHDMNRLVLFTLGHTYIMSMALYAQRLTLVKNPSGQLMGFAIMNIETFMMPEWASEWDGSERLTQNADSLKHVPKKRTEKRPTKIAHLGALGCGPLVAKMGLGSRLLDLQKVMAASMGLSFLAIEAVKPLDTDYYGPRGFHTTTPTFYPVGPAPTLVPMFCKIGPPGGPGGPAASRDLLAALEAIDVPEVAITTKEREAIGVPTDLWPADDLRHQFFTTECPVLVSYVYNYMWHIRDDTEALEALRRLTVRANLVTKEALKMWSMRFHSQKRSSETNKSLPMSSASWFKGASVVLSQKARDILTSRYTAIKKTL